MRLFVRNLVLGWYASYCAIQLGEAFYDHSLVVAGGFGYLITFFAATAASILRGHSPNDRVASAKPWHFVATVFAGCSGSYALWRLGSWHFSSGLHIASLLGYVVTVFVAITNSGKARAARAIPTRQASRAATGGVIFGEHLLDRRNWEVQSETSDLDLSISPPQDVTDSGRSFEDLSSSKESEVGRVSIGLVDLDGLPYGSIEKRDDSL